MLKLKYEKTEVLVFSFPYFTGMLQQPHLQTGYASVRASDLACNLGVLFVNTLDISEHHNTVCTASFMQLRHCRSIKGTLTHDLFETFTDSFIIRVWIIVMPSCMVCLRLLMGTKKFSVLKSLHWLPMEKVLVLYIMPWMIRFQNM